MKQQLTRSLTRLRTTFTAFTAGQKVVAIVGTAAVLVAAVMVFRWIATPNYAPLYSNLAAEDASAIVDELNSQGVPYELSNNGATVMVPRDQVYDTRISLSGQGLPTSSSGQGYSILDDQGISTSEFQEQTDFKRAMEGELSSTIEAIDGVNTAVVHLALPAKEVFADEQDPATASVLLDTAPGTTFGAEQVQAVVHLVASSVDGLSPEKVTVADAQGRVLSSTEGGALGASTRDQQVTDFERKKAAQIQEMLDRVLGPGNSTVQVTADLDFDKAVTESTTYETDPDEAPLSQSSASETYDGPASGATGDLGVVGPDGQMDPDTAAGSDSSYVKESSTQDNAVDTVTEHRENAPGAVNRLGIGVVIDTTALQGRSTTDIADLIAAGNGVDRKRGDTVEVTSMLFDRSADEAAAAELAAAAKAEKDAQMWQWIRYGGIGLAVVAVLLLAWARGRKRSKQREEATTYIVEQLRTDAAERAALAAAAAEAPAVQSPALAALERADAAAQTDLRNELATLVEKQPEDVAALLRGWLVDRR